METFISYLLLISLGLSSLFLYTRKNLLLQIVPAAVIIGLLFLVFRGQSAYIESDILPVWATIPSLLINVVFATLLIGKKIMSPRKIWKFAGPQVVFGQSIAWGQYVVGVIVTMLILVPIFNMSPLSAALIEIGFEGGHGTAAGLSGLFSELGFEQGRDLALGLATVGLVTGLASGLLFIAFHRRKSLVAKKQSSQPVPFHHALRVWLIDTHSKFFARHNILRTIIQVSLIALAITVGYLLKELLVYIEDLWIEPITGVEFFAFIPLFPLAMIGGIFVQLFLTKLRLEKIIHGPTILFIGGLALELVIIAAIATMSLIAINDNLAPFAILAVAGTIWNISVFFLLAPRIMGKYWFERGIGDYGQSMGMTATGLLLMKSADKDNKSHAVERFGYKQLLFEPVVGGGLFTAASMIIIAQFGLSFLLILSSGILIFWLVLGYLSFGNNKVK